MEFYEKLTATVKLGTKARLAAWVKHNPDLYENVSHFVRCALIREERRLASLGRSSNKMFK